MSLPTSNSLVIETCHEPKVSTSSNVVSKSLQDLMKELSQITSVINNGLTSSEKFDFEAATKRIAQITNDIQTIRSAQPIEVNPTIEIIKQLIATPTFASEASKKQIFYGDFLYEGDSMNGVPHGQGICYSGSTGLENGPNKIVRKGTFQDGRFISGEYLYRNKWFIGNFQGAYLTGKGKVYSDYEQTKLESQGVYQDDCLVTGEKYDNGCTSFIENNRTIRQEKLFDNGLHVGIFKNNQLEGEGTVFSPDRKQILEKGVFSNGKLVSGELFVEDRIYSGTFNSSKQLDGEGMIYDRKGERWDPTIKRKVIEKGTYKNGALIKGAYTKDGHLCVGNFNENKLFEGEGIQYAKSIECLDSPDAYPSFNAKEQILVSSIPILRQGTWENGRFIFGQSFEGQRVLVGSFKDYTLKEGKVYSDLEKTKLESQGIYSNNQLVTGERFISDSREKIGLYKDGEMIEGELFLQGKLYVGKFKKNLLHGQGKVYSDEGKTKLEVSGEFDRAVLINGEGCLYDKKNRLISRGKYLNKILVEGLLFEYLESFVVNCEKVIVKSVASENPGQPETKRIVKIIEMIYGSSAYTGTFDGNNFIEGIQSRISVPMASMNDYTQIVSKTLVTKGVYHKDGSLLKGEYYVSPNEILVGDFIGGRIQGIGVRFFKNASGKFVKSKHLFENGISLGEIEE